ncbi:MAG TPA: M23 family metallopeptidase [Bacteroidota bacterium]
MKDQALKYVVLLAVCGFCTFFVPRTIAVLPPPPTSPVPPSIATLYDTIATDLGDYAWPIDAGPKITSTFAEYRATHFHGGIDIGTGTRTGFKVYASRNGFVEKIRVSPVGYGKILYLRHADGYQTTYAHLDRFSPTLNERVHREQKLKERYPVTIACSPDEYPVRKGDVIGYSGETGAGSPHLHFEIRDPNNNFVNPLLGENVLVKDQIPPTIYKLGVVPLDAASAVDGDWGSRTYKPKTLSAKKFKLSQPIHITGRVGFAVSARDRSAEFWMRGVYRHRLFIDDSLLFEVKLDRAPNDDAHQIQLYYEPDFLLDGAGKFERLYVDSPNALPFYRPRGDTSGVVWSERFVPGPHRLRIVSSDICNNESELTATVIFNHPPAPHLEIEGSTLRGSLLPAENLEKIHISAKTLTSKKWRRITYKVDERKKGDSISIPLRANHVEVLKIIAENKWGSQSLPLIKFLSPPQGKPGRITVTREIGREFVRIIVTTDEVFDVAPTAMLYEGEHRRELVLQPKDVNEYVVVFRPLETYSGARRFVVDALINGNEVYGLEEFSIYPIIAGRADTLLIDGGQLRLSYVPSTALKTFFLQVSKSLTKQGIIYDLSPLRTVLQQPLNVEVRIDSMRRGQGLYFDDQLVARGDSTNGLAASMRYDINTIGILTDDIPPRITNVRIRKITKTRPSVSFSFSDDLSGVEYNELKMYIDGEFVVPEIDGEHHRASYIAQEPLAKGTHLLTIRMKDKMGNSVDLQRQIDIL